MVNKTGFQFGLETEFILVDREIFQPFWYRDLSFSQLNQILENIPLNGILPIENLDLEAPHQKRMPYVVEGYHVTDSNFKPIDILPKGVEIRTPVCSSIEECLGMQKLLFNRLREQLCANGLLPVPLSHHPVESTFVGPQNKRRYDYWLWAMEVMTTYGPDINIGVPDEFMKSLDLNDLNAKINYYAAAMTAFSVASPFCEGGLWKIRGRLGKSLRTYRRSIIAPPIEVHPDENNRLEFKVFDMSPNLQDYEAYFLLFLTLLLDPRLKGRASNSSRIYDQGAVAFQGWDAPYVMDRGYELLASAERTLPGWGFSLNSLTEFDERLNRRTTPADSLIEIYYDFHSDLRSVLKHLSKAY